MNPKQQTLIALYLEARNKLLLKLYPNDKTLIDYLNKQKTK